MNKNKKTILIKLSGASLKDEFDNISFPILNELSLQIKELQKEYNIGIVVGGGNIWRGNQSEKYKMIRYNADYMGMIATLMNSLAIESSLINIGVKCKIFSSLNIEKIAENHVIKNVLDDISKGYVAIFSCGTGMPYFSTDTGATIRAIEIGAEFILMGKNNIDGVFSDDPLKNDAAVFYKELSYDDLIKNNLLVIDIPAISLCKEYKIKIIVFKINEKNSLINVLKNKIKSTIIS